MSETPNAPRFGRLLTAMVTPMSPDGAVDVDGAVRLAAHLVESGSEGLVVTGSTGESTALTPSERELLWREVAAAVAVPVIAGSTTPDTAESVALTVAAERAGASAILAVTPYYSRPPQSGIESHFRSVAAATGLPVILYDIPIRTGRRLASTTIRRLAEVDNIIGLKDAAADPGGSARIIAELPEDFVWYSGDDLLTLPLLSVGAVGLISVAAHWCGRECAGMIAAFFAGELDRARELFRAVLPSFTFETSDDAPNPIPTKAMLRVLGLPAGNCRLPLGAAPEGLEEQARQIHESLVSYRERRGANA